MTDHVLVPVDGSPLSLEALRHVLQTFPEAHLSVLHVIDIYEPGYGGDPDVETSYEPLMGTEEWHERTQEVSNRVLEEARATVEEHGREATTASEIGDPKRVIVEYADEEDVDHVVLGAHGRADEDRALFGHVAELVARRASVPVTLVR